MRRWTKQIRALELFGEKNRLGRGSNLGQAGGNLCLWGPERFFSIVRNAKYTYPLFGRARKMTLLNPILKTDFKSTKQNPQFPPAHRVSSCAPTSRGQSKEFHTLEGDYSGYNSDFNMKKGSQKKVAFCPFFLLTIV